MPYYLVSNDVVFIHRNLYSQMFEEITKNMGAVSKMKVGTRGTKESIEVDKKIYEFLVKIKQKSNSDFEKNYVNFDLKEDDARLNVWDLLYDYCHYYDRGSLIDIRDFVDKLKDDYKGFGSLYPMGEVFHLRLSIEKYKWWHFKKTKQYISFVIDINKVSRIVGCLRHFYIYTDNFVVCCDKDEIILK